jgi:serpin B
MNKTGEKIRDLISEDFINDQVKAILVNAIYFNGNWAHKFNPKHTNDEDFYLKNGNIKTVKMMKLFDKRLNLKINPNNLPALSCEFPYQGHQISMTIILPNEGIDLEEILYNLKSKTLAAIFDQRNQYPKVKAFIPKFKFEKTIELSDLLIKMGASDMFNLKANFSGMIDKNDLFISKVIHKAIIDVNEIGTEAAGASASVIVTRSVMFDVEFPIDFICNRPFIFIIHEKLNNTILFIGKYSN